MAFTISPQAKTITYGDALSFTEEITGSYKNGDTQAEDRTGTPLWAVSGDLSLSNSRKRTRPTPPPTRAGMRANTDTAMKPGPVRR